MYGIQRKTLGTKIMILLFQLAYLIFSSILITNAENINNIMKITLFIFLGITFIRLNAMMFIWLPRGISFKEAFGNSFAFGLYYVGFPLLAIYGSNYNLILYVFALIFFFAGSMLNTTSELLRMKFKENPNNKGKLYTGGLFHYAVHINYFGDFLWVLGFALLTMNLWALIIPVSLFVMFKFSYIPNADRYMSMKYGEAFNTYQKETKSFIPYIL